MFQSSDHLHTGTKSGLELRGTAETLRYGSNSDASLICSFTYPTPIPPWLAQRGLEMRGSTAVISFHATYIGLKIQSLALLQQKDARTN